MRRALLALAACVIAAPLHAQGWMVDATAGRAAYDAVSARVGTTTASVSLAYAAGPRWHYASTGVPIRGGGPQWAATGTGGWLAFPEHRGLTLGANLGGHAYAYARADSVSAGGGGTVEVIPTAVLRRGPIRAEVSAGFMGVVEAFSRFYNQNRGYLDSGARLAWTPAPGVELAADARYLRNDVQGWPFAGGSAQVERRWGGAWAYAGAWIDESAASAGVGASVKLGARTEVATSFRREASDPVYRNLPRQTWSLSVRRRLGGGAPRGTPAPIPLVAAGSVTFRLPRRDGEAAPAVVGDFTSWLPVRMTAEGEVWVATMRVPRGVHYYGFRTGEGRFILPEGVARIDDGMGGSSAVLVVP
ncbi:MAG TPA: glycogen-binding domain-containing protein [Longimicrobium sp.]|nr:glycogen-binding domain-containing protein [Longimicrobium sp.]